MEFIFGAKLSAGSVLGHLIPIFKSDLEQLRKEYLEPH